VVDANVVAAAFLRDSTVRRIMTLSLVDLLAPDFLHEEVTNHLPDLRRRAGLSEEAASELLALLEGYVTLIPAEALMVPWDRASRAMTTIDPKDVAYLAAALAVDAPLWSDDPHLKKQEVVRCWTTGELVLSLRADGLAL